MPLNGKGEGRGFLTFAQNSDTADYLKLAYVQALSIKLTQKNNNCSVIVDQKTMDQVTDKHREIFDHIILLPEDDAVDDSWKLRNEWKAFQLTPYYETIKVESDIIFPISIDHWWPTLQQYEIILTSKVMSYEGNIGTSRAYRQLFDENNLPDLYSGLMYFRYSRTTAEFFDAARQIYLNWELFRDQILTKCFDTNPTTDVVFAIAARMIGEHRCYNPLLSFPTFTHMKGAMNGWGINVDWTEKLYAQLNDNASLTVGFRRQTCPFHYFQKHFITDELVLQYEELYERNRTSTN